MDECVCGLPVMFNDVGYEAVTGTAEYDVVVEFVVSSLEEFIVIVLDVASLVLLCIVLVSVVNIGVVKRVFAAVFDGCTIVIFKIFE